jgi:hypothetical protein
MTGSRAAAIWVAATAAMVLASASSGRPSPEEPALADVIRGAQTAELNLETVSAGYQGPGSSAEVLQPVLDNVPTELMKYYVGTLLARKVTQHQNGIRQMAEAGGGGRIGGVRTLALRDVRVSGATASVSAEVTVWFKSAQFWYQPIASQAVTSQPTETNVIDLDLHLVKEGGTWKIDQEHWQFAPGGGP